MIKLTDNAKTEVLRLLQSQPAGAFLRLAVKGGGCSGMSYDVRFDTKTDEYDRSYEHDGIRVVCDSKSLVYLDGMNVDFSNDLVGGGFRFINPNAAGTCGCGTSFTV